MRLSERSPIYLKKGRKRRKKKSSSKKKKEKWAIFELHIGQGES